MTKDSWTLNDLENVRYEDEYKMELLVDENEIMICYSSHGIVLIDQTYYMYYDDFYHSDDEYFKFIINENILESKYKDELLDLIEKYEDILFKVEFQVEDMENSSLDMTIYSVDDLKRYLPNKQAKRFNL